jgi:sigma-B regulation protein RsbU (phosphoserine phosphatase)
MWHWPLLGLVSSVAAWLWLLQRRAASKCSQLATHLDLREREIAAQSHEIVLLRKERERLELEEALVFDFFHGLGAAVSTENDPRDLHRLIVEGTLRILGADFGGLHLSDRGGDRLRPSFVSKGCPMYVDLIGLAWKADRAAMVSEGGALEGESETSMTMVSPLLYGAQRMGLLLVARRPGREPFAASALKIFQGIAEQSAFAIYNAIIFSEAAEKRRLDQDLQVAHEVQRILLPARAPEFPGYEICGMNLPARQVSGDYYDYICVDEDRCGVAIADVSGKGVPASLIMAMCRSVLRAQAAGRHSAAHTLHQVNACLFPDIREDMFISMAYAILHRDSSEVTLCRAGHDAPLLYRHRDRSVVKLTPPGMALGIDSGKVFGRVTADFTLTLEVDDCLILYTDGVTDALDRDGAEFGLESVIRSVVASASGGAAEILARLTEDLRAFVGPTPQHDDITLIVIRKK